MVVPSSLSICLDIYKGYNKGKYGSNFIRAITRDNMAVTLSLGIYV